MEGSVKHIILGAGGAIGNVLAKELLRNNESFKLVSRSGYRIEGGDAAKVDLLNFNDLSQTIDKASIVYLATGLQYKLAVWKDQWPKIMDNSIKACEAKNAKLIFFDNVYVYGRVEGTMTEKTSINPCSKKGEIRARIAESLHTEIKKKNIDAIIARAADFYGPYTEKSSVPQILVIEKLSKGHKANWLVNADVKHSYTFTGDCGMALYKLATSEKAFNQVWHLPTAQPPITGKEFIAIVARTLGVEPRYMLLNKMMLRIAGLFDTTIAESYEMLYQSEFDYVFDSSKFEQQFQCTPTPYEKGIEETVKFYYKK
ncbi:MAG: NAD-dependent epimerase/dehydratase family protein [Bacteroidota bacterium]